MILQHNIPFFDHCVLTGFSRGEARLEFIPGQQRNDPLKTKLLELNLTN